MNLSGKDIERFWSKVDKSGECWTWQGTQDNKGYGVFQAQGRQWKAHRVSFALINGAITPGLFVCHACDNPLCVNPAHLWAGTANDNNQDRNRKGRTRAPSNPNRGGYKLPAGSNAGERNPRARVTREAVEDIRRRRATGESIASIARAYGIAHSTASNIVHGRTWADGEYVGCFTNQAAAETEAGAWLHEQAERLSVYQRAA